MMRKQPYLPALLWLMIVTLLSVVPGSSMPKFELASSDKFGHALAYALLTWLLCRGARITRARSITWKEATMVVCLSSGYGVLMEWVQSTFFPSRFFEVDDMLANTFGALMAAFIFLIMNNTSSPNRQ
jgi:VanZ family protein